MIDYIHVDLTQHPHSAEKCANIIARQYEDNCIVLMFKVPDELTDKLMYLDFEKPDGEKVKTAPLTIDGNIAEYEIGNNLTDLVGTLKMDVLFGEEDYLWKSFTRTFIVKGAINASQEIIEKDPDWTVSVDERIQDINDKIGDLNDLETEAKDNLVNAINEVNANIDVEKPYISLERMGAYLYKVTFEKLPPEKDIYTSVAECSAYVQNGKLYRNLDWNYDENNSFLVQCKGFKGMAFLNGLDDNNMDDELIGQLPYHLADGVNENGIMVSTHVLFNDWEWNGSGNKSIPITKIPYLILSEVKSLDNIQSQLSNILGNIKLPEALANIEYLLQFIVTDGETTYAILPPENSTDSYVIEDITENPKLTNFRWVNSETVEREDLQTRPTGVERFNTMPTDLNELRFTKAYEAPTRLSEFIGIDGTTKDSTDEELEAIYEIAHGRYLERERDGQTWQTMHSVVYSSKGIEELYVQENWNINYVSAGGKDYELPIASVDTLGGVKIDGETVTIDYDGTIHASGVGGEVVYPYTRNFVINDWIWNGTEYTITISPEAHMQGANKTILVDEYAFIDSSYQRVNAFTISNNGTVILYSDLTFDGFVTIRSKMLLAGGDVDDVLVNGSSVVSAKVARITVPTSTSDLVNDSDFVSDASYVHTDNNYTNIEKSKLSGIETGAEANVQSDWAQTDSTADDYIKNKPSVPAETIIINDVVHTDTDKALSANMGKELNDRIQNLASIGRYLAMWDCTTGLPTTQPMEIPYTYVTGDYYIISTIGETNYMPDGDTYTGTASTVEYIGEIKVGDFFHYDGTSWQRLINEGKTVYFVNLAGNPLDNSNLASTFARKSKYNDSNINIGRSRDGATGEYSSAIGNNNEASGYASFASGMNNMSASQATAAIGLGNIASAMGAFATGYSTISSGEGAFTTGMGTKARSQFQFVSGKYNLEDISNRYAHIIGNGSGDGSRSNCHTIDWYGNAWFKNKVKVGGTSQDDAIELATKEDIPTGQIVVNTKNDLPSDVENGVLAYVKQGIPAFIWETPTFADINQTDHEITIRPVSSFVYEEDAQYDVSIGDEEGNEISQIILDCAYTEWDEELEQEVLKPYLVLDNSALLDTDKKWFYVYPLYDMLFGGAVLVNGGVWNKVDTSYESATQIDYSDIPSYTGYSQSELSVESNLNIMQIRREGVAEPSGYYRKASTDWIYEPYNSVKTNESATKFLSGDGTYKEVLSSVSFSDIAGQPTDNTNLSNALNAKENTSNKVTEVSSSSTDTQYPTAKCVYDLVGNVETLLEALL